MTLFEYAIINITILGFHNWYATKQPFIAS